MASKRPKKKVISKATPTKKKVAVKKTSVKKPTAKKKMSPVKVTTKAPVKKIIYVYEKISESSKSDSFAKMGKRVQDGELKWAYYTTENGTGYHYYLKLK
jgi:hypothetical protein